MWVEVRKLNITCRICGKPDWCCVLVGDTGAVELLNCMRVESKRRCHNGGWLHRVKGAVLRTPPKKLERVPTVNSAAAYARWSVSFDAGKLVTYAKELGVDCDALTVLGPVWVPAQRAWAFPMRNAASVIIGIRFRSASGMKWALTGSHQGLFIPQVPAASDTLWVAEGPTDAAAALTLGVFAIGRPSCLGCESMIMAYVWMHKFRRVVIVADSGEPGINGADKLAASLRVPYKVWIPPAKDLREFVRDGADYDAVQSAVKDLRWSRV